MKKTLCSLVLASFFIISCNNSNDEKKTANTYEKVKLTVEEIEKKNPERFLSATGYEKKNLIRQTVVKGTIVNNAKMVSFKDIDIKLSFYSKTGALLEEDHEMIYETIAPGDSKSFKSKFFAAKGTDSVAVKVVSARY
ncbi:MAG: hypothetical protein KBF74_08285 [Ferruginibacter sp.]|nr:hypothetical protein [Ferruginibacter sp.]